MKKTILLLSAAIALSFSANAQSFPPNPEPGKCYVSCVSEDEWSTETTRVEVRPAYKKMEVVPAEYKTETITVVTKPASVRYEYVPAVFKTVTETINVEDSYNAITIQPATFTATSKEVTVQDSYAHYEWKDAVVDCKSKDPRDCRVLCYVQYPKQTNNISTQTMANNASFTKASKGGKTITVTKEELVTPAKVNEIRIPEETKTITRRVLSKDETVREVTVDAEYRDVSVRKLVKPGGVTTWTEIDCKLTDLNVLPVFYELGSARLTAESKKVIDDKLLLLMTEKPGIRIELNSHTDSRGSAASNQDLSQRRAQSVVDYLVSKGISRNRLEAHGYGETQLKNNCADGVDCTEEQHAVNRRTEFRVLPN